MRRVYADTSAIACLIKAEPHTNAVRLWLEAGECEVVSSDLLEIELRRLAVRLGRPQGEVTLILRGISLAELHRATLRSASMLPMPYLRTLDAIHLQAALDLESDAVLTYDKRLADAAREVGFEVIAP
ncbi:type II toxin-antitoxin system VapC family toxin [Corynebacterium sp. MSK008]|uniref:type II toxin-antitoxin system VapC family toxin n=1 Tax=Corynebacterium sp. MSK008 TaxID=3050188 RepID=UPI00254C41AD|nr:type II toxin-antitoxin system VapC family toxin [Corynebacterium sp. MSK008]MDK8879752.1 type II toxin-antitoxin system VapC family toxin [Corynebacterium sp. MSK008]